MSTVGNSKIEEVRNDSVEDSTESSVRYAAYANRLRTIMMASHRYVAYTSDIGESFRPVVHPGIVRLGYGVSWGYIVGDVAYEGWKLKLKQEGRYRIGLRPWDETPDLDPSQLVEQMDYRFMMLQRGLFQSIASMGLPLFTIHSSVRYSSILFKNSSNKALKTYGPVGVGLAIVPLLPYLFDKPVEDLVDYVFHQGYQYYQSQKGKLV